MKLYDMRPNINLIKQLGLTGVVVNFVPWKFINGTEIKGQGITDRISNKKIGVNSVVRIPLFSRDEQSWEEEFKTV